MNPPSDLSLPPNDIVYNEETLESAIRTLQDLGQRQPIREPEDVRRQEETLKSVREFDFTNKEASTLSNGAWGEDRIKKKTSGIKVKDRATKEEAIKLLAQMVNDGLTLRDVRTALSIKAVLDERNASLEDMAAIIQESKESNIPLQSLTTDYRQRAEVGLTLLQLKELLSYKQQLDKIGFATDGGLEQLALAAKSHNNDVNKVIEAVNKIGGLPAIEKQVGELEDKREELETKIGELEQDIDDKETRTEELAKPLQALERATSIGFSEQVLNQIYEIANAAPRPDGSTGLEVKHIVNGFRQYSSLLGIQSEISGLEIKQKQLQTDLDKLEAESAHLQTLIGMCDTLLYKMKFSVAAIQDLVRIASGYGEPIAVLHALARYGDLKAIELEITKLEGIKTELEAKIAELDNRIRQFSGQADAIKEFITSSINPINEEFKRAAADLERTYHTNITLLKTEAAEYGKRLGEAKHLEESLKLARFFHLIIKVPSEAVAFPIDYAVFILDGVARFCLAKNVNPPVKISATLAQMGIMQDDTVPVSTVISIAKKRLEEYTNVA